MITRYRLSFRGSKQGMENMVSSLENIKTPSFSIYISNFKGDIEKEKPNQNKYAVYLPTWIVADVLFREKYKMYKKYKMIFEY